MLRDSTCKCYEYFTDKNTCSRSHITISILISVISIGSKAKYGDDICHQVNRRKRGSIATADVRNVIL